MTAQSFLLTRPAVASARFAAMLKHALGAGIRVVVSPLMAPIFLKPDLPPGPFTALVLTSETGVEAARRMSAEGCLLPIQAFCVGDRTARMAAAAGFPPQSTAKDADALVTLLLAQPAVGTLLYLHGKDSRGNIVERLRSGGIRAEEAISYEQRRCPMTTEAETLLAGDERIILPLFSPRSADLLTGVGVIRAPLWIAALSPAVADHAQLLRPERMVVAPRPDADGMLQVVQSLWVARRQT